MNVTGSSDLARTAKLQRQAMATRNALDRAGTELTSGEKTSRFKATGGNLTRLFALERALDRNAVHSDNIILSEMRLEVMQGTLERVQRPTGTLAVDLATSVALNDFDASQLHADTAKRAFADTVAALNTQVAGQALYAGTATDGPALAPADAILAELDALAAGAATAADAIIAIDAYFTAPAGLFYTNGYVGSTDDLSGVDLGDGQRLDYALRADADELVAVLRAQGMAAVVANGAFAGDQSAQMTLLREAGEQMLVANEGVLELRARVGGSQQAVETAKAERVAERGTLDLARTKIVATDPLEAASAYQALEVQLEAIYTVTARLSSLRFVNYLR